MKAEKVLEMLNKNQIEELKRELAEEIYKDNLKNKGNAKNRYAAMKRYFKYGGVDNKPALSLPCENVEIDGEIYNGFIDGYSFVLTTESLGELETFDRTRDGDYVNIRGLMKYAGEVTELIDMNTILANAKSKGYKLKKSEFDMNKMEYVFNYKDGYYKMALVDKSYSIIDDGNLAEITYANGKSILMIKTSVGICGIMPIKINEKLAETITIIKAE